MRIRFERVGGFTGMRLTAMVDTELLSSEEARDLREMVNTARFFDLPATLTTTTPGADRFTYRVTVEDDERQHTVEASDESVPEALRPLLQRLISIARSGRRS